MSTAPTSSPRRDRHSQDRPDKVDAVLAVLRRNDAVTVSALARQTGYSRPTVTSILEEMRSAGLAHESEAADQGVGRPAGTWVISPDAGIVIGLDLLPTSLLAVAADLRGQVLTARRAALATDDAEKRLSQAADAVRALAAGLASHGPLLHLAVSATGRVDDDGTVLLSDLVPVWNRFPLAERLHEELGVATTVENDINMAALGEFASRRQDGRISADGDLLFVQLARGLHTGLVLGGKIHRGHEWNAGEISDLLDLSLSDHDEITDDWIQRASLTIASVCAVVDPDAIVLPTPSPQARSTVARVAGTVSALRRPSTPTFATELSDLDWAAGAVGALHCALDAADRQVTGFSAPRPAFLTGVSLIQHHLKKGQHSTMSPATSPVSSDTLRVGVVGVGARSRFTLAAELPENNGRITAVCDPHHLVRERVRSRLDRDPDSVTVTDRVEDLIASGIDVAFVTSPDDTHADVTCALLEAGVPVYLEKPLAIHLDDATRVLETAYRTGTRLYVGHNMRHMNVVRSMRDIIRSGRIGEVKAIWCRHFVGHGGDYYFKDWHAEREHTNTLLLQKAAHDIDVMHWLADSHTTDVVAMGGLTVYDKVTDRADNSDDLMSNWFSTSHWPPMAQKRLNPVIDVEDLSMALMRMESGVYASYQQCHYTPDYWRNYTVIGTEGRIENFGDGEGGVIRLWASRSDYSAEGDASFPILGDAGGHSDADVLTITEFMRFVREGVPTDTSPLGAWYAVAAGIQAADSLRNGSRPEHVPDLPAEIVRYFNNNQNREG
ncbi:ROK family protein [Actinomyces urogenitalis]|uniref:ROK family protein n=1 Tax=Actinomyces urogenitalis TaxID=103621 RepID=UPI0031196A0E